MDGKPLVIDSKQKLQHLFLVWQEPAYIVTLSASDTRERRSAHFTGELETTVLNNRIKSIELVSIIEGKYGSLL